MTDTRTAQAADQAAASIDTIAGKLQEAAGRLGPLDASRATGALWKALAGAQGAATTVGKGGYNDHGDYAYATADSIVAEARRCLSGAGLALVVSGWSTHSRREAPKDAKQWVCCTVRIHWILGHGDGGVLVGWADMDAVESHRVTSNKAIGAAVTYGKGFVALGLCNLDRAVEDEHDVDRQEPEKPTPEQVRGWLDEHRVILAESTSRQAVEHSTAMLARMNDDGLLDAKQAAEARTWVAEARKRLGKGGA